ncbi:hypothetical protein [Sutterella wadsworthensis]|uniref:hypothetical protein n=1 Tax=Sutterella wadsworthensis TaxID=40545 RepID=UPI003966D09F
MNFLIINAGCRINGQGGTLSAAMAELAERTLKHHGHWLLSLISTNLTLLPTKSKRSWKLMF